MNPDGKIGIGVVGLGLAGALMVAAIGRHPRVALVAAVERNAVLREQFSADLGLPAYVELAQMCQDPAVDVVYVATPHQLHREHVVTAARHGKHVIVEKPMALTLEDCDAMTAAAAEAGVALVVGHSHSYDPAVAEISRRVAAGELGRLAMISMWNFNDFLYRPRRPEELDTASGGGIIYNQLPHQVDTARLIAGSPVRSVRAHAAVLDPARPTEGCCTTFLAFGNGAAASMVYSGYDHFDSDEFHFWIGESGQPKTAAHASSRRSLRQSTADTAEAAVRAQRYGYGSPFWKAIQSAHRPHQPHFGVLIATCEKADARPSADGVLLYTHDGVQEVALPAGQSVPGYGDVLDEMVAAVQGQAAAVHDGRWGRDTLAVCLAILQSAREGREIFLPAA